jgi:hypothetical protein
MHSTSQIFINKLLVSLLPQGKVNIVKFDTIVLIKCKKDLQHVCLNLWIGNQNLKPQWQGYPSYPFYIFVASRWPKFLVSNLSPS